MNQQKGTLRVALISRAESANAGLSTGGHGLGWRFCKLEGFERGSWQRRGVWGRGGGLKRTRWSGERTERGVKVGERRRKGESWLSDCVWVLRPLSGRGWGGLALLWYSLAQLQKPIVIDHLHFKSGKTETDSQHCFWPNRINKSNNPTALFLKT